MNEIEFARQFFEKYQISGEEIKPEYCPFCNGGAHRDKYTFALNSVKHTFNCMRGSCGQKGHFSELCRLKGVSFDGEGQRRVYQYKQTKTYKPPQTETKTATDEVINYINRRGINPGTVERFGVCSDSKGNIVFPFYRTSENFRNNKPTFLKFRYPRKIEKGERKMWREPDTEPILFGLHLCDSRKDMLCITEGEFDCMALYQATEGAINAVSVPSGAEDLTWLDTCAAELTRYKKIAVIGDNDDPGHKMADEIAKRLPDKIILLPDYEKYNGAKDANEVLLRFGAKQFVDIIGSLKAKQIDGLINISDVHSVDYSRIERTFSGIKTLDRAIGGFLSGDLTVWTGKRGEGKSTLLNQVSIEAVDQGQTVCIYSGEVPADRLKYQLLLCAAGTANLDRKHDDKTDRDIYTVKRDKLPLVEKWFDRRIWLYDNRIIQSDERESIINVFTAAYHLYGARIFVVDNLMTVSLGAKASEVYQLQADFVIRLRKFAEKYGVHVHVVVHPRKVSGNINDSDEVGGLGTITNIACNVISVRRLYEDDDIRKQFGCDAALNCLKCRTYGASEKPLALNFNQASKRFKVPYDENDKIYGWEKSS